MDPRLLVPGGLVFTGSTGPVPLRDPSQWWSWVPGASWRSPEGPGSQALDDRLDHPVTQVSWEDAKAYADWAGRRLPTEAEHELASRGGAGHTVYAWGDERCPQGRHLANTWQGPFPYRNTGADGWPATSPVGAYPANGYGAVDLIGNVWEWTADRWTWCHPEAAGSPCCVPSDPRTPHEGPEHPNDAFVVKGGSHLCARHHAHRFPVRAGPGGGRPAPAVGGHLEAHVSAGGVGAVPTPRPARSSQGRPHRASVGGYNEGEGLVLRLPEQPVMPPWPA